MASHRSGSLAIEFLLYLVVLLVLFVPLCSSFLQLSGRFLEEGKDMTMWNEYLESASQWVITKIEGGYDL